MPIELWSLVRLYQLSQVNIATRACARVAKCSPSMTSRLNPEKNDSAMALSQSPTVPMDWVMPSDRHAARNSPAVYWVP